MSLIEGKHYYDNNYLTAVNGIVKIDRVYKVDESMFTECDYDKLGEIYKELPGFIGDYFGCPYWYGLDYEFYLTISFEPVGLQLTGLLYQNEFEDWERTFHTLLEKADFPYIEECIP